MRARPFSSPSDGQTPGVSGHAAGVPFIAVPPAGGLRLSAPVVLAWHMLDPPRTESAFAASVPLAGLDAWRIYLGLPLTSSRLPAGGFEELARRGFADAVVELYEPVVGGAMRELPAALEALRDQLGIEADSVGILGGSAGAAVAQLLLAEAPFAVSAAVLVSPVVQLRRIVDDMAQVYGIDYRWSEASEAFARRLDFVARAAELATAAVLVVVGEDDERGIREPAVALTEALRARSAARVATVAGMAHALAEEPGTEPAPQTPHAVAVDRLAVEWFRRHLTG